MDWQEKAKVSRDKNTVWERMRGHGKRRKEIETWPILIKRGGERQTRSGRKKKKKVGTWTGEKESGRGHITRGRNCHGVNGVLPLPIISVPFEPWPLHTERSLTLSSASSRALVSALNAGPLVCKSIPAPTEIRIGFVQQCLRISGLKPKLGL